MAPTRGLSAKSTSTPWMATEIARSSRQRREGVRVSDSVRQFPAPDIQLAVEHFDSLLELADAGKHLSNKPR